MHISKRILLALMTVAGALVVGTGVALAASPPPGVAPTLVMATAVASEDNQVVVSAQFASAPGQAASSQEVSFFLEADFLGHSRVFLGSATTDATGTARLHYTPTWDGTQSIVARLPGGAPTTIEFDVTGSRGMYEPEPSALRPIREWTPVIVGAVVVLVWSTVALVLVRTTYGIAAAGRRERVVAAQRSPLRTETSPLQSRRR